MDEALAAFRQYLTAEKRASVHTLRAYLHDLDELRGSRHAGRWGTRPTLDELDVVVCRSYLASLHGANDAVTIGRKLSSLRAFFRLARAPAAGDVAARSRRCARPSAPSACRCSWARRTSAGCSTATGPARTPVPTSWRSSARCSR